VLLLYGHVFPSSYIFWTTGVGSSTMMYKNYYYILNIGSCVIVT